MSGVYKMIEVVGTSPESFSKAVDAAIAEASRTIRNISWFEVTEHRGSVSGGRVQEYQAKVRLGFKLEREA